MTAKIRIALADDHHLIRSGLKLLLGSNETLAIVGEASDGTGALTLAEQLRPLLPKNPALVGIYSGGAWIAERLRQLLGLHDEIAVVAGAALAAELGRG